MNMIYDIGDRVKIALLHDEHGPAYPAYVDRGFIRARKHPGAVGTVGSWVPGTNEKLLYVHHEIPLGDIAVYWASELEHAPIQLPPRFDVEALLDPLGV